MWVIQIKKAGSNSQNRVERRSRSSLRGARNLKELVSVSERSDTGGVRVTETSLEVHQNLLEHHLLSSAGGDGAD